MSTIRAKKVSMLWFTGSSTEGLPFIHDSFRPGQKAVLHKPRKIHSPADVADTTNGARDTPPLTVRSSNHGESGDGGEDSKMVLELPHVVGENVSHGGELTSSRGSNSRPDRDPVSFTSYMRRYKACARIKGISPDRAYAATRMRSNSLDDNRHHYDHTNSPRRGIIDSLSTKSVPMSNLRLDTKDQKSNHKHDRRSDNKDHRSDYKSESTKSDRSSVMEVTKELPEHHSNGDVRPEDSVIAKQIEDKLRKDRSDDTGMTPTHRKGFSGNNSNGHARRWRRGDRNGFSGQGSGGGGGWRPLGDIVSPRRLQELLAQGEPRNLPYTYYRTSVDKENLENINVTSPD